MSSSNQISVLQVTAEVVERFIKTGSVSITKKKTEKAVKGVTYRNFRVVYEGKPYEWFAFDRVGVSRGSADPNDKNDKRNEYDNAHMAVETNRANAPVFIDFWAAVEDKYIAELKKQIEAKTLDIGKREIHAIVRRKYSEKNEQHPGEEMPADFWSVNMKVSFKLWSNEAPYAPVRGQPKTLLLDYDKPYRDENNRLQYEVATVEVDGKQVPLNDATFHTLINNGAVMHNVRIHAGSVPLSANYVSCPLDLARAVVKRGGPAGFSDDFDSPVPSDNLKAALARPAPAINEPVAPQEEKPVEEDPADGPGQPENDAVQDLLSTLG